MSREKLAFVINSMEGGGAERALSQLLFLAVASPLVDTYDVHLILLDKLDIAQEIPEKVIVHTLNGRQQMLRSISELFWKIRELNPKMLVSFLARANCASILIGRTLKIPVIASERVHTSTHFNGRFSIINKFLIKMLYPRATRIIAVSGGVKKDLVENFSVPENIVDVIYNAYDSAAIIQKSCHETDDDQDMINPYICSVGRLVKNKNFQLLIRAYAKASIPQNLIILGQGPEEENLKSLVSKLGMNDRIKFLGYKDNPYPYVADADFFVSTSNVEGFPNSIAEAMVLGRPVIATNCKSGPSEILEDSVEIETLKMKKAKYGLLVPSENEEELSAAIEYMSDLYNRIPYEEASRLRGGSFIPENFIDKFTAIVRSVV